MTFTLFEVFQACGGCLAVGMLCGACVSWCMLDSDDWRWW